MHLKSITLTGFKSFPERTRLEFGPGISVIVGPNGSGKSNVTDAVLWALGEQSPLAVRGQSMQDVIFGGAPGRRANPSAEVELVLDDSEGSLGLGAPEISILRRLDRMGEGEYRLAGARCRLVDVLELLSDTGLGKEMHSVISQGRIESIVTSKPRDRRLLIEEAAGLGKHRKRRRRAQLKLTRTAENLDRALDVEREARSRLRSLRRQAEAAELHARLERQLRETRWELAGDRLRSQRQTLDGAQAVAAAARGRRERLERDLQSVAKRREAAEGALAAASARRETLSRRCFAAQSASERVSFRAQAVRAAATTVSARLQRSRELQGALQAQHAGDVPDPDAGVRIAALQSSLEAVARDRKLELERELVELERRLAGAGAEVLLRADAVRDTQRAREQEEERVERARARLRDAERAVETARRQAASVGGELAGVNQFLRSQAKPPGGAIALADELEVDPGYELALAAVLDGRLRAAVVADRAAAGSVLDRAGADGAVALVAPAAAGASTVGSALAAVGPSAVGSAPARSEPERPAAAAERLAEHLRGSPEALAIARALLHDAWVLASLDELPRSGRVWSAPTRELRQAAALGEERVLEQRNRREQLVRDSEAAARAEHAAIAERERAAAEVSSADGELERVIAEHRAALRARDDATELQRRVSALIAGRRAAPDEGPGGARRAQLEAELAGERGALHRSQRERAERQARIERVVAAIGRDSALIPAVSAAIEVLDLTAGAISEQRARFDAALAADREGSDHVAGELRTCAQQEAALHAQLHGENESLTAAEVRAQQARDRVADIERELGELAAALELGSEPAARELTWQEREALTARAERLARRREQLGPVNPLAEQEYADALEHVEELERQRSDLDTALRELQTLISDTDRQIRETFEQTFSAAAEHFEEVSRHLFPGGRGRLRLVTEDDRRAGVLGGARAASSAQDGADSDDQEELEPSEQDELLGVEIEVTPAGKECKRLSLLSGGEKSMTALAFLFAVFLARPCPFYILDEVEAALDDLNIDRFLELLARYSQRAQFIVVTHQKRTMEAADSLYGISMGADGVSKVISRRLPREQVA